MKTVALLIIALLLLFWSVPQTAAAQTNEEIPRLIEALKDNDASVRGRAAMALGQIGSAAHEAVPALIAALNDNEAEVRVQAASALGQLGPAAHDAIPALAAAFSKEDDPTVVPELALTLFFRIGDFDAAVTALYGDNVEASARAACDTCEAPQLPEYTKVATILSREEFEALNLSARAYSCSDQSQGGAKGSASRSFCLWAKLVLASE